MRLGVFLTLAIGAIIAILVLGCGDSKDPVAASVVLLFEHDGVRVYRFTDNYSYHYFAVPRSGVSASVNGNVSCGKDCTRDEALVTAGR